MVDRAAHDPECPYIFDVKKAETFLKFCGLCKQYKDKWAGQPIELMDWQAFMFANIYGFRRKDTGARFFKKAVILVARKQGKSTCMTPVAIWDSLTVPGGEVYCLGTKRDQAKIVFDAVVKTVDQDPDLKAILQNYRSANRLVNKTNASIIAPLSADYSTMDGLNCSTGVADEIAAYKDYSLINVIESGMGARSDPFIFEISSASDNVNSVGAQEMEQGKKCLDGIIDDPHTFYLLYTLDQGDDWKDPSCYAKANPSLGVTVPLDELIRQRDAAINNAMKEGEFRTKRLCTFISPITSWISAQSWSRCRQNATEWGKDMPPLDECAAIAGIDLSHRLDFTAYSVYLMHVPTGRFWTRHSFYIPEEQIEEKCKHDSKWVRKWIEEGYIKISGEKTNDYSLLFSDLTRDVEDLHIKEVLYDPWNAGELIREMGDKVELVEVRQSMREISPYAKSWEVEIINGNIADNNPVMSWMVSNCDVKRDENDNIRPIKHGGQRESSTHIDGCITSLMACGRLCQLREAGELDIRTAEQIEADLEAFFATL